MFMSSGQFYFLFRSYPIFIVGSKKEICETKGRQMTPDNLQHWEQESAHAFADSKDFSGVLAALSVSQIHRRGFFFPKLILY